MPWWKRSERRDPAARLWTDRIEAALAHDTQPGTAIRAFRRAVSGLGTPEPGPEELAAGLALHEGLLIGGTIDRWAVSALFATYLSVLDGGAVHVMLSTESSAERLHSRWAPVLAELTCSTTLLAGSSSVTERRTAYSRDVVVGTQDQFCSDHLRDNATREPDDVVGIRTDRLVLPNATEMLGRNGTDTVVLMNPDSGNVFSRIPVRDRVLSYPMLCGVVAAGPAVREQIEADYGRRVVVFDNPKKPSAPDPAQRRALETAYQLADIERPQREAFWAMRASVVHQASNAEVVFGQFDRLISDTLGDHSSSDVALNTLRELTAGAVTGAEFEGAHLRAALVEAYRQRSGAFSGDVWSSFERKILLTVLDIQWEQHLVRVETGYPDLTTASAPGADAIQTFRAAATQSYDVFRRHTARDVTGYVFNAAPA